VQGTVGATTGPRPKRGRIRGKAFESRPRHGPPEVMRAPQRWDVSIFARPPTSQPPPTSLPNAVKSKRADLEDEKIP